MELENRSVKLRIQTMHCTCSRTSLEGLNSECVLWDGHLSVFENIVEVRPSPWPHYLLHDCEVELRLVATLCPSSSSEKQGPEVKHKSCFRIKQGA